MPGRGFTYFSDVPRAATHGDERTKYRGYTATSPTSKDTRVHVRFSIELKRHHPSARKTGKYDRPSVPDPSRFTDYVSADTIDRVVSGFVLIFHPRMLHVLRNILKLQDSTCLSLSKKNLIRGREMRTCVCVFMCTVNSSTARTAVIEINCRRSRRK